MLETITLIDRQDNITGKADAETSHVRDKLPPMHRGVHVFVWTPDKEEMLVRYNIGGEATLLWSSGAFGHVRYGETYGEAAERLLWERLKISWTVPKQNQPTPIFVEKPTIATRNENIQVFNYILGSGEQVISTEPLRALAIPQLVRELFDGGKLQFSQTFGHLMDSFVTHHSYRSF